MGKRTGTKRSDRRWTDDRGVVWDSRFECEVYEALSADPRLVVRKCDKGEGDTFVYQTTERSAKCLECESTSIVKVRTYTPDLYVRPDAGRGDGAGYYLEVKGHLPGAARSLLRGFLKTGPAIDLRLVLKRDSNATSSLTLVEYVYKYMKIPVHVWDGVLPKPWYEE